MEQVDITIGQEGHLSVDRRYRKQFSRSERRASASFEEARSSQRLGNPERK